MGIFDKLANWANGQPLDTPAPDPMPPQTLEVIPEIPQQYISPVLNPYRMGMWVKTSSYRTGIISKVNTDGTANVSLTDADGFNLDMEVHPMDSLMRAKISEMPAKRIAHLSRNDLRALGYED